jgi:hypothetical protein
MAVARSLAVVGRTMSALPGLATDCFLSPDLAQLQLLAQYHKIRQSGVAPTATALTGATVGSLTTEGPLPGSVTALVCPNTTFPTPAPTAEPRAPRSSVTQGAIRLDYSAYPRPPTFDEVDGNSDGCITLSDAEVWGMFDTLSGLPPPPTRGYSSYDISGYDSCIDASDAARYGVAAANFSRMDIDGDGCIRSSNSSQTNEFWAMYPFLNAAVFASHDVNSSGCIDRGREYESAFTNRFAYLDVSGDGRVDEMEAASHWSHFCHSDILLPVDRESAAFCNPRLQR